MVVPGEADIVGRVGKAVTVTTVAGEAVDVQPFAMVRKVMDPLVVRVMLWVVAPVLHKLPVAVEDVSVTEPPEQNEVGPLGVIVGVGTVFTVTTVGADTALVQPETTL
jgi:hypothetical protein